MEDFITYFLLQEPNVRWVVIGMLLFSIATSVVGAFTFLQKKSLIGDAVSHSLLPGICLAFIFFQTKSLPVLLGGAVVSGWLSVALMDFISKKSKLSADAVIAVIL
ncbi:MAG: metal ABC transporter permease, partial [Chitinophagales bacterium]